MFGLLDSDIEYMTRFIAICPEVKAIGIFGSRAREEHRDHSDIDIVLYGPNISRAILDEADAYFIEQSPYPYFVDVKWYEGIKNPVFKDEVDKYVKMITK